MKAHRNTKLIFTLLLAMAMAGCSTQGQNEGKPKKSDEQQLDHKQSAENDNGSADHSRDAVDQMTLDEKIGQMVIVGVEGTQPDAHVKSLIQQDHAGGVIFYGDNIQSASQTVQFVNQLKAINTDVGYPLPLFFSVDQEGGSVSRMPDEIEALPSNKRIGKVNDPALSHQVGQLLGKQLNALGLNMDFAPVLDIDSHSGQVVGDRSFGSNKKRVSELGVQTMKGIESQHVIPVVKHFPGYGDVTTDAHTELPKVNDSSGHLEHHDWVPFQNAINHGAEVVMVTHILNPKLDSKYPASMSKKIITGMLRKKLHFNKVVITDDMTMGAITNQYNVGEAAVRSVRAGSDIVLVAHHYKEEVSVFRKLKQAVKNGEISKKQVNQSVRRITNLKQKYHLSNQPSGKADIDQLNQEIRTVLNENF